MTGQAAPRVIRKWRPRLSLIVAAMLCLAVSLPLGAVVLFRMADGQPIREYEHDLIVHSIILALAVGALTALAGSAFHRTLTEPVRQLIARTEAIAAGDRQAIRPLAHHGTAEFAQLSQSFLDMAASLAHRSDFIETFAMHVSHELKSPLTSIRGAAELLRDDIAQPAMSAEERIRFLEQIMADAGRMNALLTRLRDLARAENTPVGGQTSLAPVIEEIRADHSSVHVHASGDLDTVVRMSAENLRIVLAHLVDNAARHGAGHVSVAARRQGDELECIVRDDGPGISANNRDRIFEPFFTTRRAEGGTGMGLSIVRAMVEAHGGEIGLVEEAGAVFRIVLPVAEG